MGSAPALSPRCLGVPGEEDGGSSPAPPRLRVCDFPAVALLWRIDRAQLCRGRLPVIILRRYL